MSMLLQKEIIIKSVIGTAIEIVFWSFQSNRQFRAIIDALEIDFYQFYKVIELILRADLGSGKTLPRDVIKHLSTIEERILEEYAWQSDSLIWNQIEEQSMIPRSSDVISSNHLSNPLSPTRPLQSSLSERFGSPINNPNVKRKLFGEADPIPKPVLASKSQNPKKCVEEKSGKTRKNSIDLFYRKIYHMVARRIQHLAQRLPNEAPRVSFGSGLIQTVFTIFEHTIMNHPTMAKDRHLDQVINYLLST